MSEDKELKVMESKVRAAMKSYPQAKEALETLFGGQVALMIQRGDIVRGKGIYNSQNIDGVYGVALDSNSPHYVRFFGGDIGGIKVGAWTDRDILVVPMEKLELIYRPEK